MDKCMIISPEALEFVQDDYQDNVWYNGDEPIGPIEELAHYWDEFVLDCNIWGRIVPADLTPEIYHKVWTEIYNHRTGGN